MADVSLPTEKGHVPPPNDHAHSTAHMAYMSKYGQMLDAIFCKSY
jgi:hypothetical protein